MQGLFMAVRAIGAEFAHRIYFPIVIVIGILTIILLGVSIWLVTVNAWWWILLGLLIFTTLIAATLSIIVRLIILFIAPRQTRVQKQLVKAYVDKLQNLSETVQTPKVILLARIIKDILLPKKDGFIETVSAHTTTLKSDFQAIRASFTTN